MANEFGPGHSGATGEVTARPSPIATGKGLDCWFGDCAPDGSGGTNIESQWLNHIVATLRQSVRTAAALEGELVETMLAEAMARYASGAIHCVDTGTPNACVLTTPGLFVLPKSYFAGMRIAWRPANANTGATTVTVAGLGIKKVLTALGVALPAGVLSPTRDAEARYDPAADAGAGAFLLMPWVYGASPRTIPGGTLTLYVRTDGSDVDRDGLSNTAASAFASIQAAMDHAVSNYAISGASVTIQLGITGTYAAFFTGSRFNGCAFTISGDIGNKANYIISGSGAGQSGVVSINGGLIAFSGVTINNTSTNKDTIYCALRGVAQFSDCKFSSSGGTNTQNVLNANSGGLISLSLGNETVGNFGNFASSIGGIVTFITGATLTLTGNPAYSNAFANMSVLAQFYLGTTTFVGTATGKRYNAELNAVVFANGATLPGSIAGTTATGGQYA